MGQISDHLFTASWPEERHGHCDTLWEKRKPSLHYDPASGKTFTLAAVHPGAVLPIMLNESFERLDLSAQERHDARVARDALVERLEGPAENASVAAGLIVRPEIRKAEP